MKSTNGTLSNATTAIAADPNRRGLLIANTSDTVMTYSPDGTASATLGIPIAAGSSRSFTDLEVAGICRGAGTLFCAGASKSYTIYEW